MNATSCKVTVLRQSTVAADIRCLTVQCPDASRPAKAGQFFMLRAWAADAEDHFNEGNGCYFEIVSQTFLYTCFIGAIVIYKCHVVSSLTAV